MPSKAVVNQMLDVESSDQLVTPKKSKYQVQHSELEEEIVENVTSVHEYEALKKKNLWEEITEKYEKEKKEIEDFIKLKNADRDVYPEPLATLNKVLFPLLEDGMVQMFHKVNAEISYYCPKSTLNGLDFISEYLYNMNPKYPERQSNWTYIFDMDWVVKFLKEKPRPYFSFHLVWSRDFAALKIQSYMRGYWDRIRPDVLEVRMFWKALKEDREKHSRTSLTDVIGSYSSTRPIKLPPLSERNFF